MDSTFYRLLDNTVAEVCRREPSYPSAFPITIGYEGLISEYQQCDFWNKVPSEVLEQAILKGFEYIAKGWAVKETNNGTDPVGRFLCDSIVDAFWADQGLLALQPHDGPNGSGNLEQALSAQYSERRTPGGMRYYVRNRGKRALLLISATGTPIAIWRQFLTDPRHDFKIILPRRQGTDLFQGGLQRHVDIKTDTADLGAILDAESIEEVDLLAWCNGGRVAIDFANCRSSQVSSMVLLGPMLKGVPGVPPSASNFERDLQPLLEAVNKQSSLAPFLSSTIAKQNPSPDWNRLANSPANRAKALFALPAKDHVCGMMAPLADPQSFINIARRVASDESYPMDQALRKLQARVMLVMGSDDSIVSNQLVLSAMKQMCHNRTTIVVLKGSGHYIQDLQYHYFRWLLTEFLEKRQSPLNTARVSVEELNAPNV